MLDVDMGAPPRHRGFDCLGYREPIRLMTVLITSTMDPNRTASIVEVHTSAAYAAHRMTGYDVGVPFGAVIEHTPETAAIAWIDTYHELAGRGEGIAKAEQQYEMPAFVPGRQNFLDLSHMERERRSLLLRRFTL